jgi:hypothetical protein
MRMNINTYFVLTFGLLSFGSAKNDSINLEDARKTVGDQTNVFAVANVDNVIALTANGIYKAGDIIEISINFDLGVDVTGTPILLLNTGDTAFYVSGSGAENLIFEYAVRSANGVNLFDRTVLNYDAPFALRLNGGAITNDGDNANLNLPGLGSPDALAGSANIGIDTTEPMLTADPFSPSNNSFNVPVGNILSISFNENVSGAGIGNIQIVNAETSFTITLDGDSAFSNFNNTQLNFDTALISLNPSVKYYIIIGAGAIADVAGNEFAGFTDTNTWTFSTFGPPVINVYPDVACTGDTISIEGAFFTGLSRIIISEGPNQVTITSAQFLSITETEVSFIIPSGAVNGTLKLEKENGTTVSTTTDGPINFGSSTAELVIIGDQYICFDPEEGTAPTSTISVEIEGGSGDYTIVYSENGTDITINNYNSGDLIQVTPLEDNENDYVLISVTDVNPQLASCSPSLGVPQTITRFKKSVVDAGGAFDAGLNYGVVDLCLTENNNINLGSATEMNGNFPSIEGSVETGIWSIHQGPTNGGGFSSNLTQKTSTTIGATYYPSFSDAFAGEVILKLTSDAPSNPNNTCAVSEDFLKIRFISIITANPGQAPNICKDLNNTQINLVRLNGSSEGQIEWSLDDNYYDVGAYDNSWGFADTFDATTFTATSNNKNVYYLAKEEQLIAEDVIVEIIPIAGGGACGGTGTPVEMNIPVNNLPQPTNLQGPENTCSGEELVRFRIDRDPSFTSNTFEWSITNSANHQFDGGTNGSSVFVNFGFVSSATVETISVREINATSGCSSELLSFNITIQPLPFVEVSFIGSRAFSQSAGLLRLQGGDSAIVTTSPTSGGVFSGPGVVLNSDSFYYINTAALDETNLGDSSDDHIITFSYQDSFGCSNSIEFGIDIFNSSDLFPALASIYCETDNPVEISVNESILENNQTVTSISGHGVTYNGGNSATFDPKIARSAIDESSDEVRITYSVYNSDTDTEIQNVDFQNIQVFQNPDLVFIGISSFFCSDESNIALQRNININPNNKFTFSLVDNNLPEQVLTFDSIIGYNFHPNELGSLLDVNDSFNIEIRYTYFNIQDCQNDSVFSTVVYRRPTAPDLQQTKLCIVNGRIDTARVSNAGEFNSESIQWYPNEQLVGQPIAFGANFTPGPNLVVNDSTTFYVIRRNTQNLNAAQCLSPVSAVTFKRIDSPDFDWAKSTYSLNDSIEFTSQINSIGVASLRWVVEKQENGAFAEIESILQNATVSSNYVDFNEYGSGLFRVSLYIKNDFDCEAFKAKELVIVEELAIDQSYRFDFDDTSQGWVATGNQSSWEWAIPQPHPKATIENESALWITNNDNGTHNAGERSFVYSPLFNLSQIDKPTVSLDLWLNLTAGTDGLILEYATDDKIIEDPTKNWERLGDFENNVSSGLNWYNKSGIRAAPSTGNNNLLLSGWTTVSDSVSIAFTAKHILDLIANPEKVIFRFHFASTESSDLLDGVAFDNFIIESRNRTVLVEYFGNDAFSADSEEMTFLNNRSRNTTESKDFAWINYRVNENDPFFKENASATLSRMFYYNAYSSQSTFSLDGNYFESGIFLNNIQNQNTLNQRSLVTSPVELDFNISNGNSQELEIELTISSTIDLSDNKKLHVMILNDELNHLNKTYYHVLRTFLTPSTGYTLENETSLNYTFTVTNSMDTMELTVIAFIQDDVNGDILQTGFEKLPKLSTELLLSNTNQSEMEALIVYPNPANSSVNLYSKSLLQSDYYGRVVDLSGKTVSDFILKAFSNGTELEIGNLQTGLYSIQLWNADGNYKTLKLVVKQ